MSADLAIIPDEATDGDPSARLAARRALPGWVGLAALVVVVGVLPLLTALVALARPRWYPVLDLAQMELRVRDVGTRHTPLVGPPARAFAYGKAGYHPGPLYLYLLWPVWKLAGGRAFGLHLGTVLCNLTAVALALWIAWRRRGLALALGLAAAVAVLMRAAGITLFVEPWNPYMAFLWWLVFLLALWVVVSDDLALLPVAVFAGTYCMQTHISYAGLAPGAALLAIGAVALQVVRRRHDRAALRRIAGWTAMAAGLLVVLWIPPLLDEVRNDPGNLAIIRASFANPTEPSVGLGGEAARIFLSYLSPGPFLGHFRATELLAHRGSMVPGLVVLGVWATAAVLSWRRRSEHPDVARLHLVVAAALACGFVSITRIQGQVRHYLLLWEWATAVLVAVATGWTAVALWRARSPRAPVRAPALSAAAAVGMVATAAFAWEAAHVQVQSLGETTVLSHLAPPTVAALRSGGVPGGGEDGRYLVRWDEDELLFGSGGFGLLSELERAGLDVGAPAHHAAAVVEHRVRALPDATATVNYVVGPDVIAKWRAVPGAVEVAYVDRRSDAERARSERLHDEIVAGLTEAGLDDLVTRLEDNVFATGIDPRTPPGVSRKVQELVELGLPAAIFVAPTTAG
jgi:hypothetical protein